MREIKFRGKIVGAHIGDDQQKNWFYGSLVNELSTGKTYILDVAHTDKGEARFNNLGLEVDPKTVGQFTGLYDKNGVEIYEGDIVKLFYYDGNREDGLGNVKGIDNIIFVDGCFKLENETTKPPIGYDILEKCRFTEVIGNIHEEITNEANQSI